MQDTWHVREWREGDEEGLLSLYESVFGAVEDRNQWLLRWKWRHQDNPAGASIIRLAESDNKIVGQCVLSRVRTKIGNKVTTCGQSVETITHPDFRHRGIFTTAARKTYDDAKESGIDVLYGFPNQYSYNSFIRDLGWFDIRSVHAMIKPLNFKNIIGKYIHSKLLTTVLTTVARLSFNLFYKSCKTPDTGDIRITKVRSFDERINDFWDKISNDFEIMVVRDKEYLNWRFVDVPDADYTIYIAEKEGQILGFTVLKCERQQGLLLGRIFELVTPVYHEQVTQALVRKAIEFFKKEKADLIIIRMIGEKVPGKILKRDGFVHSGLFSRNAHFIARTNNPVVPEAFLRDCGNWFFQTGDSDAN